MLAGDPPEISVDPTIATASMPAIPWADALHCDPEKADCVLPTACWDQDYADGEGGGNGWVVGESIYPINSVNIATFVTSNPTQCPAVSDTGQCDVACVSD